MNFKGAKDYILNRLENELTSSLSYHSVEHTLDVAEAACHFAYLENLKGDDSVSYTHLTLPTKRIV